MPDVILLCETWLDSTISINELFIPNYLSAAETETDMEVVLLFTFETQSHIQYTSRMILSNFFWLNLS